MPDNGAKKRCVIASFIAPETKKETQFLDNTGFDAPMRHGGEHIILGRFGADLRHTSTNTENGGIDPSILLAPIAFLVNGAARLGKKGGGAAVGVERVKLGMVSTSHFNGL